MGWKTRGLIAKLRKPERFDRKIEIEIPDVETRLHILSVLLSKTPHNTPPTDLQALPSRAHGYIGTDFSAMVREAGMIAIKCWINMSPNQPPATSSVLLTLELKGLMVAMPFVRLPAMWS